LENMDDKYVLLAHGSGGRASHDLISRHIMDKLGNRILDEMSDGAVIPLGDGRPVMTTDSFVVDPLFFPGGDIGMLAVTGTCNDLAVMGARPLYLSLGLIVEEGFPLADFDRVLSSLAGEAERQGAIVVTGDTKVLPRGKGDGMFINTTGIGLQDSGWELGVDRVRPGDAVIVSGDIGRHGAAIMASRKGLSLSARLRSDAAPLWPLVEKVAELRQGIRFMRDPTRGGLATVLRELAEAGGLGIVIREGDLPVSEEVAALCEILGLDPLHLACEGRLVAVVDPGCAGEVVRRFRETQLGGRAAVVGQVVEEDPGLVIAQTAVGGEKIIDMLTGEPLPRIC